MRKWTPEDVAARLTEAADTARRLPPVRVQGYYTVWPAFVRREWEGFAAKDGGYRPLPPTPATIDRMMEAMRWVQALEEDQRHLVWMRAENLPWKSVCQRFACDRTTAWRRWNKALQRLADRLNHPAAG